MGTNILAATSCASAEAPDATHRRPPLSRHAKRLEVDGLADRIASLAASIDAATHQQLTAIRRFDELGGWAMQGAKTCAHWLSWRIGIGLVAAREKVRVAKALANLPRLDQALAAGAISYTKVRAITRVANANNEDLLLDHARSCTGATLEKLCAKFRRLQSGALTDPQRRFVRQRTMDDGTVQLTVRLLPDEAATVMKALHHVRDALAPDSAETPSLVDAVVALAQGELNGHDRSAPAAERRQLFVHLRREDLANETFTAELHDGTPIATDSLRRLACDSALVTATTDEQDHPLHLGRRTRRVSASLLRALQLRDRHCRFPGCTCRAFLDAHHVKHWLHGGDTSIDNLLLLCPHHHTLLHEGGFDVTLDRGQPTFHDPEGRLIAAPRAEPSSLGPKAPRTNLIAWDGRAPRYGATIDGLLRRTERSAAQGAPGSFGQGEEPGADERRAQGGLGAEALPSMLGGLE